MTVGSIDCNASAADVAAEDVRWTRAGRLAFGLVALTVVLDGFDTVLLGLAAPMISRDLAISAYAFAGIFAIGLFGMSVGTTLGGMAGDRFGRRLPIFVSVGVFGVFTALLGLAETASAIAVFRFVAGLALGALLPNGTALVTELSPPRWRSTAVMLVMMCMALGAIIAGVTMTGLMPLLGWQALFLIGGGVSLGTVPLLIWLLPESRRPLAVSHREQRDDQASLSAGENGSHGFFASVRAVFDPMFRHDSVALSTAFFFCTLCTYSFTSWLPTILSQMHVPLLAVGSVTASFHVGSVLAIPLGSWLLLRFGSRKLLALLSICAAVAAAALLSLALGARAPMITLALMLAMQASFIAIVQVALYALAGHVYPSDIKASGIGIAAGIGRIGALTSSFTAAGAISVAGGAGFFATILMSMLVTAVALYRLRRHIPSAVTG